MHSPNTPQLFAVGPSASYAGTQKIGGAAGAEHLGGNIKEGDPYTFAPRVWEYVIDRFCISSVLDLGSGIGNAAHWFARKGLRTVAIEGLPGNVAQSLYPAVCVDLTKGPVIATPVDLVHCQEVVEHIHEQFLGNLLASLALGRVILMTHAEPGQGGYHHVNEKPSAYWVQHLATRGYNLIEEETRRIRAAAEDDNAIYLAKTGLLFHRR
jgi:hypothetical protein